MTRGPLISVSCVLSISVGSSSLDLGATVRDNRVEFGTYGGGLCGDFKSLSGSLHPAIL